MEKIISILETPEKFLSLTYKTPLNNIVNNAKRNQNFKSILLLNKPYLAFL